ncbi:6995_t:CDS:2 [Funneliformis caledonium]|uniref:6995_t:CDS:1 n=1 Tax=Funneliformis caledonium TaxID=1117310 RepID=A0A9N8VJK3_9GLOM|nr:6995_t:CDS:2 [Funneliformis caledonium]
MSSVRSFTSSTSSIHYLHPIKSDENTIGNFLVRTPAKKEQPKKKELQQNNIEFLDFNANPVEFDYDLTGGSQQNPTDIELDDEIIGNQSNIITSEHWEREINE